MEGAKRGGEKEYENGLPNKVPCHYSSDSDAVLETIR